MKIRELIVEKSTTISEAPNGQGFLAGLKRGLANPYDTLNPFSGSKNSDSLSNTTANTKRKTSSDTKLPSLSSSYKEKIKASLIKISLMQLVMYLLNYQLVLEITNMLSIN